MTELALNYGLSIDFARYYQGHINVCYDSCMKMICGTLLIIGLVLAGRYLFPDHPDLASGIGGAVGCVINMLIQWWYGIWDECETS